MTTRSIDRSWLVPRSDDASHLARGLITHALEPFGEPAVVRDAVLLTSELVTNVMIHTDGDCTLSLCADCVQRRVYIGVTDASPTLSAVAAHGPFDRAGGHGLRILSAIASAWGSDVTERSKTVWFELGGDRRDTAVATSSTG